MYVFLKRLLGYFSDVNTLIQFIFAVAAIFIIVFLIVFRFRSFIYKMLKSYGIGFFRSFWISFRCRVNSKKAIRFFVEYAMLKYIEKKEERTGDSKEKIWRNIIRKFFNYKLSDENSYVIEFESPCLMDNMEVRDSISKYFELLSLKKNRKKFSIPDDGQLSFISSILFKSGFLLFTTFITGLQKIYRENWQSVIDNYVENYKKYNKGLLNNNEYFSIFNWLTWGPSYEVDFEDSDYKILQYGLFDESNSNCLILGNDKNSSAVWKTVKEKKESALGYFYSIKCKICETKTFFKTNEHRFGIVSKPIIDRIKSPANEINFVLCYQEGFDNSGAGQSLYLFTSYVWLMLYWNDTSGNFRKAFDLSDEQDNVDSLHKFNLDNAVVFFEDTNVADRENYDFQTGIIIDKAFKHLEEIFSIESFNGRKYYFVCSINDYTEQRFIEEYNKRIAKNDEFSKRLKERLDIREKPFTTGTVMKGIENKFSEQDLVHDEIDIDNLDDLHLFNTFYKEFMVKYFPDENERETTDNLFAQIGKFKDAGTKDRYHIIISKLKGNIIGGVFACYFEKTNSAFLEYIMVYDKFRSKKVGSELMNNLYSVLERDAANAGYKGLDYIFIETDNPVNAPGKKSENENRLKIWDRWHFEKVDFNYVQPSLGEGKDDVNYLLLGVRIMNERIKTLKAETLLAFLKDAYYYSMSQDNPEANKNFKAMKAELTKDKKDSVELKKF